MCLYAIGANADDSSRVPAKLLEMVAKSAGFGGAAGCIVFGVEKNNERIADELGALYDAPILIGQTKSGQSSSYS